MKTILIMVGFCWVVATTHARVQDEDNGVTHGKREWPVITNGLVFVEGEFLSPPYVVSRIENGIYINGRHLESPLPSPHPQTKELPMPSAQETKDPIMPMTITDKTSRYDKDFIRYIYEKRCYLLKKYGEDKGIELMVKTYEALPCIASAKIDIESPKTIVVTWKSGEVSRVGQIPLAQTPVDISKDEADKILDNLCELYVCGLKANNYFMFGKAQRRGTPESFTRTLAPLADALKRARDETDFLSIMKTNQPAGGMSEAAFRAFYRHKDDLPKWEPRIRQKAK